MWTFRIFQAMPLAVRVEVWSGGFEIRPIAFCVLMKVQGMAARRKPFEIQLDPDSAIVGRNPGRANTLAGAIVKRDSYALGGGRQERRRQQ